MASNQGVGSNEFGFNHLLDGQFPNQPIIPTGDLEFYGELLKNEKLAKAMGFEDTKAVEKLVRRKAEYLALAANLMTSDDPMAQRIRDIYGNDERRLAEDIYDAAKKGAQMALLTGILAKTGKDAIASDPDGGAGRAGFGGLASVIGVMKKSLDDIGKKA